MYKKIFNFRSLDKKLYDLTRFLESHDYSFENNVMTIPFDFPNMSFFSLEIKFIGENGKFFIVEIGTQSSAQLGTDRFQVLELFLLDLFENYGIDCFQPEGVYSYQPKLDGFKIIPLISSRDLTPLFRRKMFPHHKKSPITFYLYQNFLLINSLQSIDFYDENESSYTKIRTITPEEMEQKAYFVWDITKVQSYQAIADIDPSLRDQYEYEALHPDINNAPALFPTGSVIGFYQEYPNILTNSVQVICETHAKVIAHEGRRLVLQMDKDPEGTFQKMTMDSRMKIFSENVIFNKKMNSFAFDRFFLNLYEVTEERMGGYIGTRLENKKSEFLSKQKVVLLNESNKKFIYFGKALQEKDENVRLFAELLRVNSRMNDMERMFWVGAVFNKHDRSEAIAICHRYVQRLIQQEENWCFDFLLAESDLISR